MMGHDRCQGIQAIRDWMSGGRRLGAMACGAGARLMSESLMADQEVSGENVRLSE